jgi:hypothetical protein
MTIKPTIWTNLVSRILLEASATEVPCTGCRALDRPLRMRLRSVRPDVLSAVRSLGGGPAGVILIPKPQDMTHVKACLPDRR